jgi:ketosteroid isomerase-like protein
MSAEQLVREANDAFYAAVEAGDLDAMRSLWVPGAGTLCVHPAASPIHGTDSIVRSWALIMANTAYIQFFLTDVQVSLRGECALVTCTENILTGDESLGIDRFGGATGAAVNLFVLVRDRWLLWSHVAVPVVSRNHDGQ